MKEKAEKTSKEQALEMQIKLLKEALDNKDKTISRLEIENADLRAQLARRYRRTSEAISSDQLMLFNEAELGVEDGVLNDESDDLPEDDNAADSNPLGDRAKRKYTKSKSDVGDHLFYLELIFVVANMVSDFVLLILYHKGEHFYISQGRTLVK